MGLVHYQPFLHFFLVPILCMGMNSRKTLASVLVESETLSKHSQSGDWERDNQSVALHHY